MNSRDKAIARRKAEAKRKAEAEGCEANERRPDGLESSVSDQGVSPNECKTVEPIVIDKTWDLGGTSARESNGLTPRENARLDSMAIKHGWPSGEFPVEVSREELEEVGKTSCATVAVVLSAIEGTQSLDESRRSSAERNIIEMLKANIAKNKKDAGVVVNNDNRRVVLMIPDNGRDPHLVGKS